MGRDRVAGRPNRRLCQFPCPWGHLGPRPHAPRRNRPRWHNAQPDRHSPFHGGAPRGAGLFACLRARTRARGGGGPGLCETQRGVAAVQASFDPAWRPVYAASPSLLGLSTGLVAVLRATLRPRDENFRFDLRYPLCDATANS
jgi:hypothetical protein